MSRTTLCISTAGVLALLSLGVMATRYRVLGGEVKAPIGPGAWKVTMLVHGHGTAADARIMTTTPLDFGRQHVLGEQCRSKELLDRPPDARHPERREVLWAQHAGAAPGPFRARYEFRCLTDVRKPTASMQRLGGRLHGPPKAGEYRQVEVSNATERELIALTARQLTAGKDRPADQAEALFRHVAQEIGNEPSLPGPDTSAAQCLLTESGDSGGKSRLLVAMLRQQGIPSRVVTGLALEQGPEQRAHRWVEAWLDDRWVPMCPFHQLWGHVPASYLVFACDDVRVVRGKHVKDLDYGFLIEKTSAEALAGGPERSTLRSLFRAASLYMLPPAEQRLVEFLLLVPVAALIVCVFRNLVGLYTFGTFAPALLGLAFRDLHSLPGLVVFVSILLVGWLMRRVLDGYHLLQVPRVAVLLSFVVALLIGAVVAANYHDWAATRFIPLFPIVILTGMVERFWTLEAEDSTVSSFKTLLATLAVAVSIALLLSRHAVVEHMFCYPETLGLIVAGQLLIGRYTGYRLTELYRFRDFVAAEGPSLAA